MGVLLTDCILVDHPQHRDHKLTVSQPPNGGVIGSAHGTIWHCSCGAAGILSNNRIGELLRAEEVPTF